MEKQDAINFDREEQAKAEAGNDEMAKFEQATTDEKYQRLAADFVNYKKRIAADWNRLEQRIEDRLLADMLTVYDDFSRLNTHIREKSEQETLFEGVIAVQEKWHQWLQKFEVEIIDPKEQDFDHDLHDAISYIAVDSPELHDKVVQVIQKGYRRGDRILRHAQVIVGRHEESN